MRDITSHQTGGDKLNAGLKVAAIDDPGPGG